MERGISVRRLSKSINVPYSTMYELVHGKKGLERAASETVYRISCALGVTMEVLVTEALKDKERKAEEQPPDEEN